MSNCLNLALVGAGYWGKNLARNFHKLNALKLVCDPSEDVLLEMKKKYPEVITALSFSQAIKSPDIDAVVIATPVEKHFLLAKEALLANKHVFIEKPMTTNLHEAEELISLAKKNKKIIFIGHILHYHPAIAQIKKMLGEGDLGRLQYIYSNRLNLGKIRREENILWSFAPHDISVILSLVGEEPVEIKAFGTNILHPSIADTTMTHLRFPSGISAHIYVSWLHPFKEQKLVVIGDGKMVVFDDSAPPESKLTLYPHSIIWKNGLPVPEKKDGVHIDLSQDWEEPLFGECQAFINALSGSPCITDGEEGLKVLRVLQGAQECMDKQAELPNTKNYFTHETSIVDEGCSIGKETRIWHYSHILKGSKIGECVNIGQNVMIGPNGIVGNNVKIQNNVSVYEGVTLEDDVFCGLSCVFTNVINPRSNIPRKTEIKPTLICKGATIGANSTILCGITIGKHAFIGAGSVVTGDIPDHGLAYGNPATLQGWMCECGHKLGEDKKCKACEKQLPAQ